METAPARLLRSRQVNKFLAHHQRIHTYERKCREISQLENRWEKNDILTPQREEALQQWQRGWRSYIDHERERLEERFPPSPEYILPTGLGNTIAASEHYPYRRYHIDPIRLWPRFVPALLNNKYAGFIEGEKSILDFLVNLLLCAMLFWPVGLGVFLSSGRVDILLLLISILISAIIVYGGACVAAVNWGNTVKSAFDLYRFELMRMLHLKMDANGTLSDERRMWQGISEFLAFGRIDNFAGFDYPSALAESRKDNSKEA